ncbi:hypothetical protein [Sinomonas flava]|uniref:hypothetical protein n=1 Tax=Sinomonas flava TaxID=496857 RepID=UPI0039A6841E
MPALSAAQSRAPSRSLRTTAIAGTVTALAAGACTSRACRSSAAWAGGSLPTVNTNWTVVKVTQKLGAPQKIADGSSVGRTARRRGREDPVLPDRAELGQTDWKEIPAEGQDPHGLKAPAPPRR